MQEKKFFLLLQEKVQKEIDAIIGIARWPIMKDKPRMPFTEACIMECQRLGNIALFSVPRCVSKDTKVNGYSIPKGTWVFINRWVMFYLWYPSDIQFTVSV